MNVSDLPPSTRRVLLDKVRDQVGSSNYDQMVSAVGEDGVLEALLDQGNRASAESDSSWGWGEWLGLGFFVLMLFAFASSGYENGGGIAGALGNVSVMLLLIFPALLWWIVKWLAKATGIVAAGVVAVGVAAAAWLGLWMAAKYVGAGTAGWFGWLLSHF